MDKKKKEKLPEMDMNSNPVWNVLSDGPVPDKKESKKKKIKIKKKKELDGIDEDIDYYFSVLEKDDLSKDQEKKEKKSFFSWYYLLIITLVLLILSFSTFILYQYDKVKVVGNHMGNTLINGTEVLYKEETGIHRFNVVLVNQDGHHEALRVIGMPGDKVEMKDDALKINDAIYDEVYLKENYVDFKLKKNQLKKVYTEDFTVSSIGKIDSHYIPENSYILLGDDRQKAKDSRQTGFYTRDQIDGVILMKIKPFKELGPVE